MTKKKKDKGIVKSLRIPFGLAGVSIGSNLIGSALDSRLPIGTVNPLTSIGSSAGTAAGLTGTIALTGVILKEVKNLKPKKVKRRKK